MPRLTLTDVNAWCQLARIGLTDFERKAIAEIDAWHCYWMNSSLKQKQDAEEAKRKADAGRPR